MICCFMYLLLFVAPIVCAVLCWSLLWYAFLCVLSSFAIIQSRKRESWLLCFQCLSGVLLLLMLCGSSSRCRGLVCSIRLYVIVVFPDHTHLLLYSTHYHFLILAELFVPSCMKRPLDNQLDSHLDQYIIFWYLAYQHAAKAQ